MKIRNGFVSNSSSSSFILLLKRKPKSVEDTLKLVYPIPLDQALTYHIHYEYQDDMVLHAPQAADLIYKQLMQHEDGFGRKEKGTKWRAPTKIQTIGSFVHSDYYWIRPNDLYPHERVLESYISEDDRHALIEASLKRNELYEKQMHLWHKYRKQHEDELKKGKPEKFEPKWEDVLALMNKHPDYVKAHKEDEVQDEVFKKLCDKIGAKIYHAWVKQEYWVGIVNFGDEDGAIGATMEHGNAFNKIKHIRISQH